MIAECQSLDRLISGNLHIYCIRKGIAVIRESKFQVILRSVVPGVSSISLKNCRMRPENNVPGVRKIICILDGKIKGIVCYIFHDHGVIFCDIESCMCELIFVFPFVDIDLGRHSVDLLIFKANEIF